MRLKNPSAIRSLFSILVSAIVFFSFFLLPRSLYASLWKYAVNRANSLYGKILIADEKGIHWEDELPAGWEWTKDSKKPDKYYIDLDQIHPEKQEGKTVLHVSRWNVCNIAVQDGFAEATIAKKLKEIQRLEAVVFREDTAMTDARKEFRSIGSGRAKALLYKGTKNTDFSLSSKGIIIVNTTQDRMVKIFVENYGSAGFLTVSEIADTPKEKKADQEACLVRNLEHGWGADLDEDGLIDITWSPISNIRSSGFQVRRGYRIALYKIYER